jgi:peptidoglycan/LPS O-acetylase OafA/YrhL
MAKSEVAPRLEFIGVLRGVACLFVVYAHVIVNYASQHHINLQPVQWIQDNITTPFAIIQNFGWFGVVLFFLISGYIITHTMQRETAGSFVIKRVFRIYPAFVVCVLINAIARHLLYDKPFYEWNEYLLALTLSGIWPTKQYILLGVEWTLVIEMKFYALTLLAFWLHKRRPEAAVAVQLFVIGMALYFCRAFENTFFLFTVSISYVPFLIAGQLLYLLRYKKIQPVFFVVATMISLAVAIYGIRTLHPRYLSPGNSYMVTFTYCYGIFCLAAVFSDRIRSNFITTFFENISYSLYLYHGLVCFTLLDLLTPYIANHWIRLVLALAAGFLVSWWSFRYIEKPAQSLSRTVIQSIRNLLSSNSQMSAEKSDQQASAKSRANKTDNKEDPALT